MNHEYPTTKFINIFSTNRNMCAKESSMYMINNNMRAYKLTIKSHIPSNKD